MKKYLLLLFFALSGCSTQSLQTIFTDVQGSVDKGTGIKILWSMDAQSESQIHDRVQSLLSKELSANDAAEVALLNNKRIQAVYEELGIARSELLQAGLLKNPLLEVRPRFPSSGSGGVNLELGLSQNIFDSFFIPLKNRVASSHLEVIKATIENEILIAVNESKKAYYELESSKQLLEVKEKIQKAFEASYITTKSIYDAGNTTVLALKNDEALFNEAKLEKINAKSDLEEKKEKLNSLLGIDATTVIKIPVHLPFPRKDAAQEKELEDKIEDQNIEVKAARLQIEALKAELKLTTASLFSDGELGASSERDTGGSWATGFNLLLPLPIFDQGQGRSENSSAKLHQAEDLYKALLLEKKSALRANFKKMNFAFERAALYQQSLLPLRKTITEESQKNYNAMLIGVFDLLISKKNEIQTATGYIDSLKEYWIARSEVEKLISNQF